MALYCFVVVIWSVFVGSCDVFTSLQWHHNERISNHQHLYCLLNHLFRHRSKKTSKLRVTGLCEGNSPLTGEFPIQRVSNVENVSIWWHHHAIFFKVVSMLVGTSSDCPCAREVSLKNMGNMAHNQSTTNHNKQNLCAVFKLKASPWSVTGKFWGQLTTFS